MGKANASLQGVNMITQEKDSKVNIKKIVLICLLMISFDLLCFWIGFATAKNKPRKVAVDFSIIEDDTEEPHKYAFLSKQLSDYICNYSAELGINPNLVVSILMVENPEFNPEATHRNQNGTIDCGLFQLNDRYLWTTFRKEYWFDNVELDPFNWKHNAYIAMNHINSLQKQLKLVDEVIMAYNCGVGPVMDGTVPEVTKVYLAKVKNNIILLNSAEVEK